MLNVSGMREKNAHNESMKNIEFLSLGTNLTDADGDSFHMISSVANFAVGSTVSMVVSHWYVLLAVEQSVGEVEMGAGY